MVLLVALFSDGTGPIPALGTTVGVLPLWQIWTILGLLAVLGLRDKVIFLAARGEVYASFTVAFLFAGYGVDMIIAAKLVCVAIWMGAATSKLNKHFPFVISTMMSNNPLIRTKWLKRKFFEKFPDDLRPGPVSRWLAHFSTAIEMLVPLALFFSHGGWPTAIAAFVMVCFHFGILSAIPMGVPLEWNVFMIFSVLALFVGHAEVGLTDMTTPLPVLLFALLATIVVLGNLFPHKISFLPGMRYYAGNWDTTWWCIKPSANEKIERGLVAIASMPASQLEKFYGSPEQAMIFLYKGYAFRGFNSHGKALLTLVHNALAGRNQDDYVITEGERLCSTAVGWNFGDGHMHNEQLIAAMQERCHFEPDEVRVILLDAQPIQRQRQAYRLVDAATGEFERGYVNVSDMVTGQPWTDDIPVHVEWSASDEHRNCGQIAIRRNNAISSSLGGVLADDVADLDGLESLQQQVPRRVEVLAPMRFRCGTVARPHELHQAPVRPHHLFVVGLRHRAAFLEDECGVPHRDLVQHARDDRRASRCRTARRGGGETRLWSRRAVPTAIPRGCPRPACGRARRRRPSCLLR